TGWLGREGSNPAIIRCHTRIFPFRPARLIPSLIPKQKPSSEWPTTRRRTSRPGAGKRVPFAHPTDCLALGSKTIGYNEERCFGGESVSQSPLKDKAFLSFLVQNPP